MLKPMLAIAATGIAAVLLWKVLAVFMLPLLGLAIGLVALLIKIVFVFVLLMIAYWIYRKSTRGDSMA